MAIARDTQQMELVIDDCRINFTDAFKLLGIIIDKDLNFSQHISEVCIKTSKMIGVLQRLKNLIPMNAKLRIYKTAVLPHLTYCSLVWHFCRASDRNKLERINERGLRTVFKDRVSPYGDLLTPKKISYGSPRKYTSNFTKWHATHEIFRILPVFSQFLWNLTFLFWGLHEK